MRRWASSSVASCRSFATASTTNYFFGIPGQDEGTGLRPHHGWGVATSSARCFGHIALALVDLDATLIALRDQGSNPSGSRTGYARAAPGSGSSKIPIASCECRDRAKRFSLIPGPPYTPFTPLHMRRSRASDVVRAMMPGGRGFESRSLRISKCLQTTGLWLPKSRVEFGPIRNGRVIGPLHTRIRTLAPSGRLILHPSGGSC